MEIIHVINLIKLYAMKKLGIVLLVVGAIGLLYFGYEAIQSSESFEVLGVDVAVSQANWTPVIISVVVALAGLIMSLSAKKK